jgi:hypothetical protein
MNKLKQQVETILNNKEIAQEIHGELSRQLIERLPHYIANVAIPTLVEQIFQEIVSEKLRASGRLKVCAWFSIDRCRKEKTLSTCIYCDLYKPATWYTNMLNKLSMFIKALSLK